MDSIMGLNIAMPGSCLMATRARFLFSGATVSIMARKLRRERR